MSLMKISTDPTQPGEQLLLRPGMTSIGIDVDCHERFLFWSDVTSKTIMKADYAGQRVSAVVTSGLISPEGIAVDWLARNLYWTDSQLDRIEVAKLGDDYVDAGWTRRHRRSDTHLRPRKILVNTNLVNPRAIVVQPTRGRMFWADWNRHAPKIEVANMDGSERKIFIEDGLGLPNGLTLVEEWNQLCVADAKFGGIYCLDLDNPQDEMKKKVVYEASNTYPFGVVRHGDAFFWTDWKSNRVEGVGVVEGEPVGRKVGEFELPIGGNGRIYGIAVMSETCPNRVRGYVNPCARDNGGCGADSFCFARQDGSATCACPDGDRHCAAARPAAAATAVVATAADDDNASLRETAAPLLGILKTTKKTTTIPDTPATLLPHFSVTASTFDMTKPRTNTTTAASDAPTATSHTSAATSGTTAAAKATATSVSSTAPTDSNNSTASIASTAPVNSTANSTASIATTESANSTAVATESVNSTAAAASAASATVVTDTLTTST